MRKALATASLLLLPTLGFAKTTTYDWTGQVSESSWKVAVGDIIHGTLTIDDETPASEDLGDTKNYAGAAYLTFQAGGQDFRSAQNATWFVNTGAQGCGDFLTSTEGDTVELDFTGSKAGESLDLTENGSDFEKVGPFGWGAVLWDSLAKAESQFTGSVVSFRKRGDVADAGLSDIGTHDAAPTPEPSSFILMGSALLGFAGFKTLRRPRA